MLVIPGERIKEVTAEGLTYLGDDGEEGFIDFALCFQNFVERSTRPEALKNVKEWNHMTDEQLHEYIEEVNKETVVGGRDFFGNPGSKLPSITFWTEPLIEFVFSSQQEWGQVLYAIKKTGWRTQDLA